MIQHTGKVVCPACEAVNEVTFGFKFSKMEQSDKQTTKCNSCSFTFEVTCTAEIEDLDFIVYQPKKFIDPNQLNLL